MTGRSRRGLAAWVLVAASCVPYAFARHPSSAGMPAGVVAGHDNAIPALPSRLRRPVALAVCDGRVLVANRHTGTVTVLDPGRAAAVLDEVSVGGQLADLVPVPAPDGRNLLVADEVGGGLVLLDRREGSVAVAESLAVGRSPVSVCPSPDGSSCSVALLWPRRLVLVDVRPPAAARAAGDPPRRLRVRATVDLPFSPREQWFRPDGTTLVVADAFGGRLAVIDPRAGRLLSVRSIEGHHLRGLTASPDGREMVIAHQLLAPRVPTEESRIVWGQIVGNFVRSVPMDHLLRSPPESRPAVATAPIGRWSLYPLGQNGAGGGDPGDVLVTAAGTTVVALSGVNEIAVRRADNEPFYRIGVGRRPTALAADADGRRIYVANTFDDTISVVDLPSRTVVRTIPLGPPPQTLDVADRGEMLFYDARLSLDGWYSCHSCHTDGHTSGLLNDNHSDGSFGTPKRILSLLGTADTGPWAWTGGTASLDEQVRKSILVTMRGKPERASDENVRALTAYLRTLRPPPSRSEARRRAAGEDAKAERGRRVFERRDCGRCHESPTFTSPEAYDVGLRDEAGRDRFNPPSLRGVAERDSFFHDGRAADLREVFTRFGHPEGEPVPPGEVEDLLEFLGSI